MFSRLITVLLFTLFFSEAASGQKLWTLQECIEYARANNINIKQAAISSELLASAVIKTIPPCFQL
ncbi:MAG: hypothetical protein ACKOX7_05645 [Bacteroidota bacterium]